MSALKSLCRTCALAALVACGADGAPLEGALVGLDAAAAGKRDAARSGSPESPADASLPRITDAAGGGGTPDSAADALAPADAARDGAAVDGQAPAPSTPGASLIYVGGSAQSLAAFHLDAAGDKLSPRGQVAVGGNVGYVTTDASSRRVFAISGRDVIGFSVGLDGTVTKLGQGAGATGDVHGSVHPGGRWLFSANYNAGTAGVQPIDENGKVGASAGAISPGPQAHGITPAPSGKYVYVPCRAGNRVAQYLFDAGTGKLTPNDPAQLTYQGGPRHIAFHPHRPWAYLVTEDSGSVVSLAIDEQGRLGGARAIKMKNGEDWGAHIVVAPDGRHVYASGRRTNTLFAYAVDQATGALTPVGEISAGVAVPRDFAIDPRGRFLAVANMGPGNLVIFKIDPATGKLTRGPSASAVSRAQAVGILTLP